MFKNLYVWHNLNNDTYYYKFNAGTYKNWKIGEVNQYNHQLVLIIANSVFQPDIVYKTSIRKKVLTKIISFLQKLDK